MRLVLDASLALSWFFKDQRVEKSVRALRHVKENGALVPALWNAEIVHVLVKFERKGIVTDDQSASIFAYLRNLPISVEVGSDEPAFAPVSYARAYQLSAYDATYLDLAIRFGLKLATLDERLEQAARSLSALWMPLPQSRQPR